MGEIYQGNPYVPGGTSASARLGSKGTSLSSLLPTLAVRASAASKAKTGIPYVNPLTSGAGGYSSDEFVYSPSTFDLSSYLPQPTTYTPPKALPTPYTPPKTAGTPGTSIDPNQYKLSGATAADLAAKYGFDYSRNYANAIAELEKQLKENSLGSQLNNLETSKKNFTQDLTSQYFQQFLQKAQDQTNAGLNAGIAADQNVRLEMNRQNAAAAFNRQASTQQNDLFAQLSNLPVEAGLRSETIYQDRLQQMMQNIGQENQFNQSNLDRMLQIAQFNNQQSQDLYKFNNLSASEKEQNRIAWEQLQQSKAQFASEQAWREYTFNNLSASERAQLENNISQFGAQMAWNMQEAQMANQLSMTQSMIGAAANGANIKDLQNLYGSANFLG